MPPCPGGGGLGLEVGSWRRTQTELPVKAQREKHQKDCQTMHNCTVKMPKCLLRKRLCGAELGCMLGRAMGLLEGKSRTSAGEQESRVHVRCTAWRMSPTDVLPHHSLSLWSKPQRPLMWPHPHPGAQGPVLGQGFVGEPKSLCQLRTWTQVSPQFCILMVMPELSPRALTAAHRAIASLGSSQPHETGQ